uniref:Uncharacterized protein n=1 Tax=Ixodes ricinus TaxID=34613 RepID=A0A6B0V3Y3_IXORI
MLERLPALHVLCGLDVLAWRPLLRTSAVVGLVHGLWGRPMSSSSESRLAWTRVNSSSLKTSLCDVRFTERLEPWCKPSESAIAIEVSGVNTLSCDTLSPIEYGTTGPLSLWSSSGTDCSSPVDLDFLDGPTTSWEPCRLAFHRKILRTALSGWNFFRLPSADPCGGWSSSRVSLLPDASGVARPAALPALPPPPPPPLLPLLPLVAMAADCSPDSSRQRCS